MSGKTICHKEVTVKVGPKGRVAIIPLGWRLIKDDLCCKGDMFANTVTTIFQTVETDDIGMPSDTFDALIRKKLYGKEQG